MDKTQSEIKKNWMKWCMEVVDLLKAHDLDAAANYLACCVEYPESEADLWGQRTMFTLTRLRPHHQVLWQLIRPAITDGYQMDVAQRLRSFGWSI